MVTLLLTALWSRVKKAGNSLVLVEIHMEERDLIVMLLARIYQDELKSKLKYFIEVYQQVGQWKMQLLGINVFSGSVGT